MFYLKQILHVSIFVKEEDSNCHLNILPEYGGVSALLLPVGPQLIDGPFVHLIDFRAFYAVKY